MGRSCIARERSSSGKFCELIRYTLRRQLETIMSLSKVKQNFHAETEGLINKQINMELHASYTYLSMAAYFDRDDIALPGFAKRFREASLEEREHAEKLISYQNLRGGRVVFKEIAKPSADEWGTAIKDIVDLLTKMKRAGDGLGLHVIDKE